MMKIQVLGSGCRKCKTLAANATAAADAIGIDYELEKVSDINEIVKFGVMITPALVIDGKVKITGRIPDTEAIKAMLA